MSAARSPRRIAEGVLTDGSKKIDFEFDGRVITGLAGDTVASALLANGVQLVGRSFKYHRPRGIVTAGPEEPCALIDIVGAAARAPNRPATTVRIAPGLRVASQNRWPSLQFDLLSINSLLLKESEMPLPSRSGDYYNIIVVPYRTLNKS